MRSLILLLLALSAKFHTSTGFLDKEPFVQRAKDNVEKWTNVLSENPVLRLLPAEKIRKCADFINNDSKFEKLTIQKDRGNFGYCFHDVEEQGTYGDLDKLLESATKCLVRSIGKGFLAMTLSGELNGTFGGSCDGTKDRLNVDFGQEEQTPVSVSFIHLSDSNYISIYLKNKLRTKPLTGTVVYKRAKSDGVLSTRTTSKTHLVSASLRVNCKMDYDTDTTNTNTASDESTTEITSSNTVQVVVPPGSNKQLIIQPLTRIEKVKAVQPVLLNGYIGVVTDDKKKWYLPVSELAKFLPNVFTPKDELTVEIRLSGFQQSQSFYFYKTEK